LRRTRAHDGNHAAREPHVGAGRFDASRGRSWDVREDRDSLGRCRRRGCFGWPRISEGRGCDGGVLLSGWEVYRGVVLIGLEDCEDHLRALRLLRSSTHIQMRIHFVNPSDVSFGTAVITPRWLYVLAAATPGQFGTPEIVDETLDPFDAE